MFIKFGDDCMLISGQKQPPEVFYKKAILRILAKFTSNIYKETPVLESHFSTSAGGHFQNLKYVQ